MMKISLEWLLVESSKLQDHRQRSCVIPNVRDMYAQNILHTFPRYFPVDGKAADLFPTCCRQDY